MRLALERTRAAVFGGEPHVLEVVTPRTNLAALTSAEHVLGSIALPEPFALEIAADRTHRRLLVRASTARMRQQLETQLGAAYPQADLRPVAAATDPARCTGGEQVLVRTLHLRSAAYLPIRTFTDLDLDGERAAQADPVLGILGALGDLPPRWRGLSQVVLQPAADDWCQRYLRLSVQHPLEHERVPHQGGNTRATIAFLALLLLGAAVVLQAVTLWRAGDWLRFGGLVVAVVLALACGLPRLVRLLQPPVYDMELVREKVSRIAYHTEVRLAVFAPFDADRRLVDTHLERLAAAYKRYNLAAGNGFISRPAPAATLHALDPVAPRRRSILTTLELAGLWHLPHAAADVALLERTSARRWLPMPATVADGCRIGESTHQGRGVPVALPDDLLARHLLLVAKTRRGKSTLMLRLAQHAMDVEPRRAVVLVDPHRDLAMQALTLVPEHRADEVVYLDVADQQRPFGLNLLDVGLGWDRDRAVANALTVFEREWGDQHWGPRMEDVFRFAMLTLFEANVAHCTADPEFGRSSQHTLLEVPTILSDARFRKDVLRHVSDGGIHAWWSTYYEPLDRRLQQEIVNPVLSKIHRIEGTAVRHIAGQPASTVNPSTWVRDGRIAIVNTARGSVGENAAALVGSTILNLVALGIAEQANRDAATRGHITLLVDEFHTIPGADYEGILSELSKYGANLVLATQSLTRLAELDRAQGRGLRAVVFANIDGLFAFNCSAEDAEYLAPELGGAVEIQDLVELSEHQCYARISSSGRRLPAFSVQLDPPVAGDVERGRTVAAASSQRYGRELALVAADRQSAHARIEASHTPATGPEASSPIVSAPADVTLETQKSARNEHRPRKKRRTSAEVVNVA